MAKPYLLQELENKEEKVFYAIYNETTYEELLEAYNSGRMLYLDMQDKILEETKIPLMYYDSTRNDFSFGHQQQFSHLTPVATYSCSLKENNTNWQTYYINVFSGFICNDVSSSIASNIPLSSSIKYFRPILISTSEPTSSDGGIGDIWIKYST